MSFYLNAADDSQLRDNSQLTALDEDSQLTVAKGLKCSPPVSSSTLLAPPAGIALIRQQVFELHASMTWTTDEYALYWPFVDNIWAYNHTGFLTKKRT